MNSIEFQTVYTPDPKPIDSRALSLKFEFYRFTQEECRALRRDVITWLQELTADHFVCLWTVNDRRTSEKTLSEILSDKRDIPMSSGFGLEAFVKSPFVQTQQSAKQILRKLACPISESPYSPGLSVDYREYISSVLHDKRPDNETFLAFVRDTFRQEGRFLKSIWTISDAQALLCFDPYVNDRSPFWGSFEFDICVSCLGDSASILANHMSGFLQKLSETYHKLNGRVMLQPLGTEPHMRYFYGDALIDYSHEDEGLQEIEWYSTYYLRSVEWANVISPLAAEHVPDLMTEAAPIDQVEAKALNGGGLLIQSQKDIRNFDIPDLLPIKKLVHPALYPGRMAFSIRDFFKPNMSSDFFLGSWPRSDWANIPMLDDEIDIISTYLVFSHHWE